METKKDEMVKSLSACIAACNNCFNSCLKEEDVKMMVNCIKLDKDCAEICGITLASVASNGNFTEELIQNCITACKKCAEECRKYPHEHCKECARVCEECAESCRNYSL